VLPFFGSQNPLIYARSVHLRALIPPDYPPKRVLFHQVIVVFHSEDATFFFASMLELLDHLLA